MSRPEQKVRRLLDRQMNAVLDDSRGDRVAREPRGVVDVQLAHEILAVLLDRLDADSELGGRLLVGHAFGDELKDLDLARRQSRLALLLAPRDRFPLALVPARGDGRTEERV